MLWGSLNFYWYSAVLIRLEDHYFWNTLYIVNSKLSISSDTEEFLVEMILEPHDIFYYYTLEVIHRKPGGE